ncbi:hypothetical protein KKA95_01380 [Patescibacteria group bacterium]|nr:hypothetical protein [Patescibacteria group bacterium]
MPQTAYDRKKAAAEDLDRQLAEVEERQAALGDTQERLEKERRLILEERDRIAGLHIRESGEDPFEKERERVVEYLIGTCAKEAQMKKLGGDAYDRVTMSPGVIAILKEAYDHHIDPEFVNSILFIFGMSGSLIDLDNIKNLDPNKPEDKGVIEELMGLLNRETYFAIETCKRMIPRNEKERQFINERIQITEQVVRDFKGPKMAYLYMREDQAREASNWRRKKKQVEREEYNSRPTSAPVEDVVYNPEPRIAQAEDDVTAA